MATRARRAAVSLAICACAAMATGAGHGSRLLSRGTSALASSYRPPAATSPASPTAPLSALDLVGGLQPETVVHAPAVSPASVPPTQATTTVTSATTTQTTTPSAATKANAPAAPTPAFPPLIGGNPPPRPPPPRLGFDMCEAPSVEAMAAWKAASPYSVIGIYVGGPSRMCPNLALRTPAWLTAVEQQGWSVIPTYVGPQAPCSDFHVKMAPANFFAQGVGAANEAVAQSRAAGLASGSAIYLDMEAYPPGNVLCEVAVHDFVAGWSKQTRDLGFVPGVYGSLFSAVSNASGTKRASAADAPDAIWVAAWNGLGNILGFTPSALPDDVWSSHARIHQYAGDHPETWGGVSMRIDSDVIDGPVGK